MEDRVAVPAFVRQGTARRGLAKPLNSCRCSRLVGKPVGWSCVRDIIYEKKQTRMLSRVRARDREGDGQPTVCAVTGMGIASQYSSKQVPRLLFVLVHTRRRRRPRALWLWLGCLMILLGYPLPTTAQLRPSMYCPMMVWRFLSGLDCIA